MPQGIKTEYRDCFKKFESCYQKIPLQVCRVGEYSMIRKKKWEVSITWGMCEFDEEYTIINRHTRLCDKHLMDCPIR